jgi:hypothetical protein
VGLYIYINIYIHPWGIGWGAMGGGSHVRGIKLQLTNGVGLNVRIGIVSDVLEG